MAAMIRADLARLFILHKAEVELAAMSDFIAWRVTDIAAVLTGCASHALAHDDHAWLRRHEWWRTACGQLFEDPPAVPLDR